MIRNILAYLYMPPTHTGETFRTQPCPSKHSQSSQQARIQVLASILTLNASSAFYLPFTCSVTLGKSLFFLAPQFPLLEKKDNNNICLKT